MTRRFIGLPQCAFNVVSRDVEIFIQIVQWEINDFFGDFFYPNSSRIRESLIKYFKDTRVIAFEKLELNWGIHRSRECVLWFLASM